MERACDHAVATTTGSASSPVAPVSRSQAEKATVSPVWVAR